MGRQRSVARLNMTHGSESPSGSVRPPQKKCTGLAVGCRTKKCRVGVPPNERGQGKRWVGCPHCAPPFSPAAELSWGPPSNWQGKVMSDVPCPNLHPDNPQTGKENKVPKVQLSLPPLEETHNELFPSKRLFAWEPSIARNFAESPLPNWKHLQLGMMRQTGQCEVRGIADLGWLGAGPAPQTSPE